jgi:hypothetical protein
MSDPPAAAARIGLERHQSWEETAKQIRERGGWPEQYERSFRMASARAKYASAEESLLGYFARRSIPFLSAGFQIGITQQYKSAQDRLSAGKATGNDYDTIARYEQLQEFDRNREREEKPSIEP